MRRHYPEGVTAHPEIPFAQAVGMRNVLSHGYFRVDLEIVWAAIHTDLLPMYDAVLNLLESLPRE